VYLQAAAAAPTLLANALTERASELRNVEICHLHMFRLVPTFNILYQTYLLYSPYRI